MFHLDVVHRLVDPSDSYRYVVSNYDEGICKISYEQREGDSQKYEEAEAVTVLVDAIPQLIDSLREIFEKAQK